MPSIMRVEVEAFYRAVVVQSVPRETIGQPDYDLARLVQLDVEVEARVVGDGFSYIFYCDVLGHGFNSVLLTCIV
jgi:hypothetical protein